MEPHARIEPALRERRHEDALGLCKNASRGERIGTLTDIIANTPEDTRDQTKPWLLAPVDLAAVKAAGVTFARSLLERVIEEQAKGSPEKAQAIRATVEAQLGGDLRSLVGAWGAELKQFAFGDDDRALDLGDEVKSISSENTFLRDTEDRPTLRACLKEQAGDVAKNLAKRRLSGSHSPSEGALRRFQFAYAANFL